MPQSKQVYRLSAAAIESAHDVGIGFIWPGIEPVSEGTCLDLNLLRSSASQPYQECFGVEVYPTIQAKAAYLFYHLVTAHIFSNGNKRTAVLCLDTFLLANSFCLVLTNDEVHDLAQDVAEHGEKGKGFHATLQFVERAITANMIPLSTLRATDLRLYRFLHARKWEIRRWTINQPDYPLNQR